MTKLARVGLRKEPSGVPTEAFLEVKGPLSTVSRLCLLNSFKSIQASCDAESISVFSCNLMRPEHIFYGMLPGLIACIKRRKEIGLLRLCVSEFISTVSDFCFSPVHVHRSFVLYSNPMFASRKFPESNLAKHCANIYPPLFRPLTLLIFSVLP